VWRGRPAPPLGEEGSQRPCLAVPSASPREKVSGTRAFPWTQFLLTDDWRNPADLPPPPISFGGRLDEHPTSLLYLPMDSLPLQRLLHAYHITWPCPSLCPKGLTVYTLYIVPVPITSCRDLEPSNGESFICHFETYLLVRVLLFCPNCANCPSSACNP